MRTFLLPRFGIALGLCWGLSGSGAQAQPEPPAPDVPEAPLAIAVADQGAPIALASKLPLGFAYETSVTTDARRKVQVGASVTPLYERTVIITRSRVTDVAADGTSTVENEFRAVMLREESSGALLLNYDSSQPPTAKAIAPADQQARVMSRVYAPLIGKKYQVRVAPDGSVLEVTGVTEITDAVMNAVAQEGVPDAQIATIRRDFERSFGGDRLREHFYSVAELPPLAPVKVNEPWTRRFLSGDADLPLVVRSTGSVAQHTGDEVVIYERGDLALDESATDLKKSRSPIDVDFSGTHRGGTRLDLAQNRRTSRLLQQYRVAFTYNVPAAPDETKPSTQHVVVQGTTYYLIEVHPVTA